MSVTIGDVAPEFALRDQHGQTVSLADFRGAKIVVLVFYPLAFTGTCQGELCSLRDDLPRYENDEVQVLTVSVDSTASHRVWAEREGFLFPLLADFWPHGEVARQYGVLDEKRGYALRGTFVIDKEGVVRWRVVNDSGESRDQSLWKAALEDLGVSA
ncbi:MAG: peroxiredoxin [Geodermatophilaceae bacterium]|nr:MAG: peroxiredoxin [Pseudonocardiales bacterium]